MKKTIIMDKINLIQVQKVFYSLSVLPQLKDAMKAELPLGLCVGGLLNWKRYIPARTAP